MKKFLGKWILLLMLSLPIVFLACGQKTESAKSDTESTTTVRVAPVQRGEISNKISFTGEVQAWQTVDLVPEVAGKIAAIYVEEGDHVKEGQVLAELDTRAARLQLEQAQAGLAVAQANLNDAQRNLERSQSLFEKATITEQQFEKMRLAYEAARAQLQQAEAALHLAQYQVDVSVMKAPFAGVVTGKWSKVGDVINPMMSGFGTRTGVVSVMDVSKVKILVDVPPNQIEEIAVNQPAELTIESLPGKVFQGRVTAVNPAADPTSKTFRVQVVIPNPESLIRPGIFGAVTIKTLTHQQILLVPSIGVLPGDVVFVAEGGKAVRKKVTVGIRGDGSVEIESGLAEGEQVIVQGNYGLEDGTPVRAE